MRLTRKKLYKLKKLKNQTSKSYRKRNKQNKKNKFHNKRKRRSFRRKKYINLKNKTLKRRMQKGGASKNNKRNAMMALGGLYGASVAGTVMGEHLINSASDGKFWETGWDDINDLVGPGGGTLQGPISQIGKAIGTGFNEYANLYNTNFATEFGMEGFEATADVIGIGGLVGITLLGASALVGGWYYIQELREQTKKRKLNVHITTADRFENEKNDLSNENKRLRDNIRSLTGDNVTVGKKTDKLNEQIEENKKKIKELEEKINKHKNAIPKDLKMAMDSYEEPMKVTYKILKDEIELDGEEIGIYSIVKIAEEKAEGAEAEGGKKEGEGAAEGGGKKDKTFILDRIVYDKYFMKDGENLK